MAFTITVILTREYGKANGLAVGANLLLILLTRRFAHIFEGGLLYDPHAKKYT